jgi:hypothetical protein
MAAIEFAVGGVTRTGAVVLVALTGTAQAPRLADRWEVPLISPELPAQPYHAAAELESSAAESLVGRVEQAAEDAAATALIEVMSRSGHEPAGCGIAVLVKATSVPSTVEQVLRSHAWMHAAEGVLYRNALLAAGQRCGWLTRAVEASRLPANDQVLAELGAAAGHPWRRAEKDAARAALTLLPTRSTNA